eukprot:COSAG06_NODE_483_length_15127_cov_38.842960_6_plen_159_part_00
MPACQPVRRDRPRGRRDAVESAGRAGSRARSPLTAAASPSDSLSESSSSIDPSAAAGVAAGCCCAAVASRGALRHLRALAIPTYSGAMVLHRGNSRFCCRPCDRRCCDHSRAWALSPGQSPSQGDARRGLNNYHEQHRRRSEGEALAQPPPFGPSQIA